MNKDNGGPAFPTVEANYHNENMRSEGISIRDYFAAKALAGMLADRANIERFDVISNQELVDPEALMATAAYQMADAMLKVREK